MEQLDQLGISYYNPQRENWVPEMVQEERDAILSALVLVFVLEIDGQRAGPVSFTEAACYRKVAPAQTIVVEGGSTSDIVDRIVQAIRAANSIKLVCSQEEISTAFVNANKTVVADGTEGSQRLSTYVKGYDASLAHLHADSPLQLSSQEMAGRH